jgi:hypothetical protein
MLISIAVIAVSSCRSVVRVRGGAETLAVPGLAITIVIIVPVVGGTAGGTFLIYQGVTVIIIAVAGLGGPRVDSGFGIIAITTYRGVIRVRGSTQTLAVPGLAITIVIIVPVVGGTAGGTFLIYQGVAVIIYAVADLGGRRVDIGVGVVAVSAHRGSVVACGGTKTLGIASYAVVIIIDVFVVSSAAGGAFLVRQTVAVIIYAVADLGGTGVDIGVGVVAVSTHRGSVVACGGTKTLGIASYAVVIIIDVFVVSSAAGGAFLVRQTVAVIIYAVADLGGRRVDSPIAVIAVS